MITHKTQRYSRVFGKGLLSLLYDYKGASREVFRGFQSEGENLRNTFS